MANAKITRLRNEYKDLQEIASRSPYIEIVDTDGRNPPEKYEIKLVCKGIRKLDSNGQPIYASEHKLRIFLPPGFPGERPLLSMMTPVWHPNIASSGNVCYGDQGDHGWAASMKISDLIIRLMEMIRYENVCENSAFNASAATWSVNHKHLFPLETGQIIYSEDDSLDPDDIVIYGNDPDIVDDLGIVIHDEGKDEDHNDGLVDDIIIH